MSRLEASACAGVAAKSVPIAQAMQHTKHTGRSIYACWALEKGSFSCKFGQSKRIRGVPSSRAQMYCIRHRLHLLPSFPRERLSVSPDELRVWGCARCINRQCSTWVLSKVMGIPLYVSAEGIFTQIMRFADMVPTLPLFSFISSRR